MMQPEREPSIGSRVCIERCEDCRFPWGRWWSLMRLLGFRTSHDDVEIGRHGTIVGIDRALASHRVLVVYDVSITPSRIGGRYDASELVRVDDGR
jgi:hypothetical protein